MGKIWLQKNFESFLDVLGYKKIYLGNYKLFKKQRKVFNQIRTLEGFAKRDCNFSFDMLLSEIVKIIAMFRDIGK